MRTFYLFLAFAMLCISSCQLSPEKKAQKLIVEKLKLTLHDWDSYESVQFGKLDSLYSSYLDDSAYIENSSTYEKYQKLFNKYLDQMRDYSGYVSTTYRIKYNIAKEMTDMYLDSLGKYAPICDSLKENYVPKFIGWTMNHSFRSNNAMGNKTIGHFRFFLDKDLSKILESKDISESASDNS